jgi:hypothetical protein
MIYRAILVLCGLVGCLQVGTDEPVIVDVTGNSGSPVALRTFDDPLAAEATDYRWAFSRSPGLLDPMVLTSASSLEFIPYGRGEYWVDRFVVLGVAENLTHRFVVDVSAGAAVAVIDPMEYETRAGENVTLDGSPSYSKEGLPLTFEWRNTGGLVVPGLPAFGRQFTFIAPNAPGEYRVRLVVKDAITSGEAVAVIRVTP